MNEPDLSVSLGRLRLKNPVMPASGTFNFGKEYAEYFDLNQMGAVVNKSVMLQPRQGNAPPRIVETPCGMLNSIGLPSQGIEEFLTVQLPFMRALECAAIVSVSGTSAEEFGELVSVLDRAGGVDALELNLSCPNFVDKVIFATDCGLMAEVLQECRRRTSLPLIAKLSPNVTDIVQMARLAEKHGADMLCAVNTFTGMAIDVRTRRPVLGTVTGGLSGPAIKPIVLRMVWQITQAVGLPVIACGGISNGTDAVEFLLAGAAAVQVGTANFINPLAIPETIAGIRQYMLDSGPHSVTEIIGAAWRRSAAGR